MIIESGDVITFKGLTQSSNDIDGELIPGNLYEVIDPPTNLFPTVIVWDEKGNEVEVDADCFVEYDCG